MNSSTKKKHLSCENLHRHTEMRRCQFGLCPSFGTDLIKDTLKKSHMGFITQFISFAFLSLWEFFSFIVLTKLYDHL